LTELYRVCHCSLSTFHHGRSINLAAANAETCISQDIYLMSVHLIGMHLRTYINCSCFHISSEAEPTQWA
jgi:hypothetical protein